MFIRIFAQIPTPTPFPTPEGTPIIPPPDIDVWNFADEAVGTWNMIPEGITLIIQATILVGIIYSMAVLFLELSDKLTKKDG